MTRWIRIAPESLIQANVLADAFSTAFLSAGIGYLTVEAGMASTSQTMSSIGIGIALGAAASILVGRAADRFGSRELLSVVQIIQIIAYASLYFSTHPLWLLSSIVMIFFLGRLVSPLRGALPPRYISKDDIIPFKTRLRTLTLATVVCGGLSVAVVANIHWTIKLCAAVLGGLCYMACFISTKMLASYPVIDIPKQEELKSNSVLSPSEWRAWLYLLAAFSFVAIGSAMIPFVLARIGNHVSWLLFISSLIGISVNLLVQKIGQRQEDKMLFSSKYTTLLVGFACGLIGLALILISILWQLSTPVFIAVMLLVFIATNFGQTLTTIVAWDVQYNVGREENRAYIIAIFSLTSSLGSGFAQLIGANVFSASLQSSER